MGDGEGDYDGNDYLEAEKGGNILIGGGGNDVLKILGSEYSESQLIGDEGEDKFCLFGSDANPIFIYADITDAVFTHSDRNVSVEGMPTRCGSGQIKHTPYWNSYCARIEKTCNWLPRWEE